MATTINRYESVSAIRAMIGQPCKIPRHVDMIEGYCKGDHNRNGGNWYGMQGGADAVMSAMLRGFPEGETKVEKLMRSLDGKLPRAVGIGRKLVRGAQGDELDIHAVNRGDISRAWSSRQRQIKKGKTALKIVADIGGNRSSSADSLQWRGIAAIALSEIMTKAGYGTELVAAWAVRGHWDNSRSRPVAGIECVVKARGVSADRGLLAATLALTGFFRTVGFAAIIRSADNEGKLCDSTLGCHVDVEQVIPAVPYVVNLFVPASINCESDAVNWIKSTVSMLQSVKGVN